MSQFINPMLIAGESQVLEFKASPQVTPQVTPQVKQLIDSIVGDMTRQELMTVLELKDRKHFAENYLQPALNQGLIEMTLPDKPNSRLQKYRLTNQPK